MDSCDGSGIGHILRKIIQKASSSSVRIVPSAASRLQLTSKIFQFSTLELSELGGHLEQTVLAM